MIRRSAVTAGNLCPHALAQAVNLIIMYPEGVAAHSTLGRLVVAVEAGERACQEVMQSPRKERPTPLSDPRPPQPPYRNTGFRTAGPQALGQALTRSSASLTGRGTPSRHSLQRLSPSGKDLQPMRRAGSRQPSPARLPGRHRGAD